MDGPQRARLLGLSLGIGIAVLGTFLWLGHERRKAELARETAEAELLEQQAAIHALLEAKAARTAKPPSMDGAAVRAARPEDRHWYMPLEVAQTFFKVRANAQQYDPWSYYAHIPNLDAPVPFPEHPAGAWRLRTNGDGLREDGEIGTQRPAVRVLVCGDSHTDGFCDNADSFVNVIESRFRAEGAADAQFVNVADAGYSFHNYLGVYERWRVLSQDAFVVVVYGGNDFRECMLPSAYFRGEPAPATTPEGEAEAARARELSIPGATQFLRSLLHFRRHPEDRAGAVEDGLQLLLALARACREDGVQFGVAYLPTALEIDRVPKAELFERLTRELALAPADLAIHDGMGDLLLSRLDEEGVPHLDLRPALRDAGRALYWSTDLHLNLDGHRAVAEALLPFVRGLLAGR